MKRELPKFEIEGTPFIVDVVKGELIEAAHPANVIRIEDLKYHGTHYSMSYDTKAKNLPALFAKHENAKYVELPQLTTIDPEGMAEKYNLPLDKVKGKTDFEVIVDPELLGLRLKGLLPRINIAGTDYTVDVRLEELRPVQQPWFPIRFNELEQGEDGVYRTFYDKAKHEPVYIDTDTVTNIPKDTIVIEIPPQWALDPVGVARKYDCNPIDALVQHPINRDLKAKEIPLSQTPLPKIVESNRNKRDATILQKKRTRKTGRRHRR